MDSPASPFDLNLNMHHMVGDESDLMDDLSLGEQDRLMGMDMDVGSPSVRRTGTKGGGRVGGESRGKDARGGGEEREEEEEGGEKIVLPRPKSKVKSSRLSLFARPQDQDGGEDEDEPRDRNHYNHNHNTNDDYNDDESESDHTQTSTTSSTPRTHTHSNSNSQSKSQARDRDRDGDRDQQKLKESLWELKKMVQVFEGFETSLRASKAGNEVSLVIALLLLVFRPG
jgi:hypothetical protein